MANNISGAGIGPSSSLEGTPMGSLPSNRTEVDTLNRLFHAAIREGDYKEVVSLLDQGVSVSGLVEGISPLYRACVNRKMEIAQLLLAKEANPTQENDADNPTWSVSDYVEQHRATPLRAAMTVGSEELIRLLAKNKAALEQLDEKGWTPLFRAVVFGQDKLAIFLIEQGANVHIMDGSGTPLIMWAIQHNRLHIVAKLVERGADVNQRNHEGFTPLCLIAGESSPTTPETLSFILKYGAREVINTVCSGSTPMRRAVHHQCLENVKILVKAGADLSMQYDGVNILSLAQQQLQMLQQQVDRYKSRYRSEPKGNLKKVADAAQAIVAFLQQAIS